MRKDAQQIIKDFRQAQIGSRKDYEAAVRGDIDPVTEREKTQGGGLIQDVNNLESGHPELLDQTIHWSERATMAQQIAINSLQKQSGGRALSIPQAKLTTIAPGETAEAMIDMLRDPAKYHLTPKQVEELVDAAWFIREGEDALNPEKIEGDLKKAAPSTQKDKPITVSKSELNDERKKQTLSYFEKLSNEELKKTSNTDYDLRGLESSILFLHQNNDRFNEQSRAEALTTFSAGVAATGAVFAQGDGASLFKAGGELAAKKVAGYAAKKFGIPTNATEAAAKVATTAILASIPAIGPAVAKLVGPVIEKYVAAAIDRQVKAAKKAAKYAALAAGGLIAFLTAGAVSAAATVGITILGIAIGLPVLLALIIFIINSGGYLVPPGQSVTEVGVLLTLPAPDGGTTAPATCPNESMPKPVATGILFSSDRKYAFPLAPLNRSYYTCGHWDGSKASDMGIVGITEKGWTGKGGLPVLAYTSGTIESISLNDSKGGKYIILAGSDGRFYYYAHNCALYVTRGQRVNVGDVIAITDNTGSAANSVEHLHFAISNAPNFIYNGTICPSTDFQQKFGLMRCAVSAQCPPL